jgi:hypothetical protein
MPGGLLAAGCPGERALVWVTAGTTSKLWSAALQATQVKVDLLDVHIKICYEGQFIYDSPDELSIRSGSK